MELSKDHFRHFLLFLFNENSTIHRKIVESKEGLPNRLKLLNTRSEGLEVVILMSQ